MGKKVLRYTENEFVQLLENIVKKVKKESINESPKFRDVDSYRTVNRTTAFADERASKDKKGWDSYSHNTKWDKDETRINAYIEKFGNIKVYMSDDDSVKIACVNNTCYDQTDTVVSREEAADMLGVDSLESIEMNESKAFKKRKISENLKRIRSQRKFNKR